MAFSRPRPAAIGEFAYPRSVTDFYLFGNNPRNPDWTYGYRGHPKTRGYDILLDRLRDRTSVFHHADRIGLGDRAAVFQFDGGWGNIVAVARIRGSALRSAGDSHAVVPWKVHPLSRWVRGEDLRRDRAFRGRKPFIFGNMQFASPILLDEARWEAITSRLARSDRNWIEGGP